MPPAVVDVLVEAPSEVAPVHDERSTRAADEGDQRVSSPPELLVLGGRQKGLRGVGLTQTTLATVDLEVVAVDPPVGALELLARDEEVPHLDDALPADGVVLVGDGGVDIPLVLGLLHVPTDHIGSEHELVLNDLLVDTDELPLDQILQCLQGTLRIVGVLRLSDLPTDLGELPRELSALIARELVAHDNLLGVTYIASYPNQQCMSWFDWRKSPVFFWCTWLKYAKRIQAAPVYIKEQIDNYF
ncbi:MAG: hypothetical protein CO029_01000 [Candidatus Magasanikbacteria bacterium CG_4_9_14_0_2_um_filter_41_10]|uniref:Uncharacterized protein n=1 Tax=Candidatus Magasanikbacteria bacterium CG_4_10_14_0_2_um_filter_41_31 TaxID=1974639 RepID=A0A2M7V1Q9_9BACT|nr:MAG: hypothetical protein AUJ37_04060 [Candidatus Magasanikbacteria bacterium CG1_02_41_34]PIZ92271.1 MAG: hypothetical protein COX83_04680 [Candidatus Magasanikbacteria bacterium CG_4_10_14_0_2_um_filter_41_31]PJC53787.1 MAG: hypothetical protein CO029_01000 [Candidatus Magasanikbacteria bacterium CG_4_9_14_0_2_um_filter_41_10]